MERNEFLRKMRIFKDALAKFSPADRRLWQEQVEAFNEDLIALSKRESIATRAASWRKTCAGRVPNRQIQQATEKRKRLEAIRKIVDELETRKLHTSLKIDLALCVISRAPPRGAFLLVHPRTPIPH